jgi:hypothetical protein
VDGEGLGLDFYIFPRSNGGRAIFLGKVCQMVTVAVIGVVGILIQHYREKSYTRRSEEKRQSLIPTRGVSGQDH